MPDTILGHSIYPVEIPVLYDTCFEHLTPFIAKFQPDIIVMLGLASGSKTIRLERVAINLKDSIHPDNAGVVKQDEPIVFEGETAYFSMLPLRKIETALQEEEVPVSISNSAGLYICNNLFYHTMHYINTHSLPIKAGFIHVPDMEQTSQTTKSLPLVDIVNAVVKSIYTIIEAKE